MKKFSLIIGTLLVFSGLTFAQTKTAQKTGKTAPATHKGAKTAKGTTTAKPAGTATKSEPKIPAHTATPVIKAVPQRSGK